MSLKVGVITRLANTSYPNVHKMDFSTHSPVQTSTTVTFFFITDEHKVFGKPKVLFLAYKVTPKLKQQPRSGASNLTGMGLMWLQIFVAIKQEPLFCLFNQGVLVINQLIMCAPGLLELKIAPTPTPRLFPAVVTSSLKSSVYKCCHGKCVVALNPGPGVPLPYKLFLPRHTNINQSTKYLHFEFESWVMSAKCRPIGQENLPIDRDSIQIPALYSLLTS